MSQVPILSADLPCLRKKQLSNQVQTVNSNKKFMSYWKLWNFSTPMLRIILKYWFWNRRCPSANTIIHSRANLDDIFDVFLSSSEYFQGWRFHSFCRQTILLFDYISDNFYPSPLQYLSRISLDATCTQHLDLWLHTSKRRSGSHPLILHSAFRCSWSYQLRLPFKHPLLRAEQTHLSKPFPHIFQYPKHHRAFCETISISMSSSNSKSLQHYRVQKLTLYSKASNRNLSYTYIVTCNTQ